MNSFGNLTTPPNMGDLPAALRPLLNQALRQTARPTADPATLSRRRFFVAYTYSFLSLAILAGFLLTTYNLEDFLTFLLDNSSSICNSSNLTET